MTLLLLLACEGGLFGPSEEELLAEDNDADGFSENQGDCDDAEPRVFPDNPEVCDGLDNNCDGFVDEGEAPAWFLDADSDGYGGDTWVLSCTQPGGYVPTAGDCDESDPQVNPEGVEEGCDGVDDDCDGEVDEGFSTAFYVDADRDGYGDPDTEVLACEPPGEDYVDNDFDCDDEDVAVNPLAADVCNGQDDDCDGEFDEDPDTVVFQDLDGDGFGTDAQTLLDCSADEGWSSTDDDCDDSDPDLNPTTVWYLDVDGDGYGVPDTTQVQCEAPSGYAATDDDCDDGRTDVYPEAEELCDGADQDCDGAVDEGSFLTFYLDQDGDGYGLSSSTTEACSAPSNYVADSTDCDDTDEDVNPGEPEVCDGADQNCDGQVDEDVGDTFYLDADGDGFGLSTSTTVACALPSGYAAYDGDCNDGNASINPNGTETCNAADDDCDGQTDEGVTTTYYEDGDGDSYGLSTSTTEDCTEPSGYASVDGDCDDADSAVNPSATEVCDDGVDNDCDGSAGTCGISAEVDLSADYDAKWVGEAYGDYAGHYLALGDINGDGDPDLLVGAYRRDSGGSSSGSVYVIYGPDTSGGSLINADEELIGTSGAQAGYALASGDTNGDGYDDVIAAGPYGNGTHGVLWVMQGPVTTANFGTAYDARWLPTDGGYCCESIDGGFDVDGDGTDDVLVSNEAVNSYTGRAYLLLGPFSGDHTATASYTGSATGDQLGARVIARDFSGDGTEDFLLAAPLSDELATNGGSVYLVHGPGTSSLTLGAGAEDLRIRGSVGGAQFGDSVGGGDLDGDGQEDLLVGATKLDQPATNAGAFYAFFNPGTGISKSSRADVSITGVYTNQAIGFGGGGVDMDGDGQQDLVMSGPFNASNSSYGNRYYSGITYVFYGPMSGSYDTDDADSILYGAYYDAAGSAGVATDWDGDGDQDLWLGARFNSDVATYNGAAYLVLGGGI